MKKITLTSGRLIDEKNLDLSFKTIADAGMDGIDLSLDMALPGNQIEAGTFEGLFSKSTEDIFAHYDHYRESMNRYRLHFYQAHAPFQLYVYKRDDINKKCYEVLEKCFALCQHLGIKYIVVHPVNIAYQAGIEEEFRINLEYYTKMIPMIKKYGVTVCLENMFSSISRVIREAVCSNSADAVRYIDLLNEKAGFEAFGFCLDTGHLQLLGKNMRRFITELGPRIKVLHLHENDGISDNHGLPYMYTRQWGINPVLDWDEVLNALHEIHYSGTINFELVTGLMNIPEYARGAAIHYLKALGEYFSARIED